MKKAITILVFTVSLSFGAAAQEKIIKSLPKITVNFKNNSFLPHKYVFVCYWTKDRGNNSTEGVILAPYATKTITDVVGTELFLANDKQVDTVMQGKKIEDKPFLVFKSEDNGKTINLRKN